MCFLEFEYDGDRIPKVLKCGHTFCWGCIQKLAKTKYIRCPNDGKMFFLKKNDNLSHLKKNFKAMNNQ
ncbi:hypothetical protein CRE_29118 [Caenorhabditis remanei]|uniref:RING-type domain-containing protein n=1 Tax=Caenorhabditis remanei TaxID=31234 RepID=E3N4M3_CAERE|nr:hypothetical protein CRE_29118 [Caenorhabditis remanei]